MNPRRWLDHVLPVLTGVVTVVLAWAILVGYPLCPKGKTLTMVSGEKLSFVCR